MSGRAFGREFAVVLGGLFVTFTNVMALVPVLPVVAERTGGSSGAGIVTAAFYFPAVATQLNVALLLQRHSARRLLSVALALLGLPCVAYAVDADDLGVVLGATALRGVGFGIATVVLVTLVAQLASPGRRGTAVGYAGLVSGIPPVFAPAAGVHLLHHSGERTVFIGAGVLAVAGAAAALTVRPRPARGRERPGVLLRAMVAPALLWPLGWFGLASLTRGAVVSFVPLTLVRGGLASAASFLLVFGTTAYVARWAAGHLADRHGSRPLVLPGIALSLAGLVLLAAGDEPGLVVAAGALYGAGNGTLMSASQLEMLARRGSADFAVPTTVWNFAIDGGFGLGGVLLGLVAAAGSYDTAFWVLPGVMALALILASVEPRVAPS